MILKASLHIHTSEDRKDGHMIAYDVYELIDEAERAGFKVLGFTPHQKFVFKPEYAEYAREKGILLIPGVERRLGRIAGNHVIILNCGKSAEKVRNFKQLISYKAQHPEVLVLCPHPAYSRLVSVGARNLRRFINVFDAIEHSWFYSYKMNSNRKARQIANEFNKPFLATADVHSLKKLDTDYILLETSEFSVDGVLEAIRAGSFENITFPKKFINLAAYLTLTYIVFVARFIQKKIMGPGVRSLVPVPAPVRSEPDQFDSGSGSGRESVFLI